MYSIWRGGELDGVTNPLHLERQILFRHKTFIIKLLTAEKYCKVKISSIWSNSKHYITEKNQKFPPAQELEEQQSDDTDTIARQVNNQHHLPDKHEDQNTSRGQRFLDRNKANTIKISQNQMPHLEKEATADPLKNTDAEAKFKAKKQNKIPV